MRTHFHRLSLFLTEGRFWYFRLFTSLATIAFGLVCLWQPDLFSQGKSFSGMVWLPQWVWGLVAVAAGALLLCATAGRWRQLAYLLVFFFHISLTISFVLGSGTILTGTTTYGLLALFIAYAGITEPQRFRGA
ncbi:hypothetical protein GO986_19730 [Deinococcus sp. HMF7620]|uniref:Uncharacterized protein n=1 Tax=Deinococcus arboris TaxID=2682977 RepID=A0A7C9I1W0_9DEIO|nr:hypothetical protein [Deinococcus arboris]MVN88975.1 hypothetical protein [Deinococcus arboris]